MTTVTVTTTGSGSFTIPAGVSSITVEAWGGGGAGGNQSNQGGGGGGGAYISATIAVTAGQILYYTVGAAGGQSWFNLGTNSSTSAWRANAGTESLSGAAGIGGDTLNGNVGTLVAAFNGGSGASAQSGGGSRGGSGGGGGAGPLGVGLNGSIGSSSTGGAGGAGNNGSGGVGGSSNGAIGFANIDGGGGGAGGANGDTGGTGGAPAGGGGGSGRSSTFAGAGARGQLRYTYEVGAGWDSTYKGSGITISNGDRTVTGGGSTSVAARLPKTSGKHYFEVKHLGGDGHVGLMLGTPSSALNDTLSNYSIGYRSSDGAIRYTGSYVTGGATFTTNDVIGVAVDRTNNKVWFSKNNVWQNGNPETNSGGVSTGAVTLYGAVTPSASGYTANFTGTTLAYAPPTGFAVWDGSAYQGSSGQRSDYHCHWY